jgi:hypothetical protein
MPCYINSDMHYKQESDIVHNRITLICYFHQAVIVSSHKIKTLGELAMCNCGVSGQILF